MKSIKKILILFLLFAGFQTTRAEWTRQTSGTLSWLRAVYFLDENRGWIAGGRGTLLTTIDGGKNWKISARFTDDAIRDVYFADVQNGWILCEQDVYNQNLPSVSYLMRTTDGGATWEKAALGGHNRERLARIFFDKKGYGYAVGETGAFFAMTDDRQTWKKSPIPALNLLLGGSFADDLHGALVGGGGTILFTEDGGMTWNAAAVQNSAKSKLNSVFFLDRKNGWTVGAGGKIYATMNGGRFWREQRSNTDKNLTDVFFVNTAEGWATGDEGVILHTTTAGNVWTPIKTDVRHRLERVFFAGRRGWAVGFGGTIVSYEAGKVEKQNPGTVPQLQNRTPSGAR